ncbi:MAG: 2-C-methyl-D-erythritol 2,4-cyclodiphosphate synthase, partial [Actinomycetota bacterium]|nr:2-C-methyl-D-erythritol 2,4-cyclodiphosphate synthase [Actinomycetota bacterium]
VVVVDGDPANLKLTTAVDLAVAAAVLGDQARPPAPVQVRVGQGVDVHPWSDDPDRPLVLGGVTFEGRPGLAGHSDADAVAHACTDALLGAAGLGDIGEHFPDSDPAYAGADSIGLLRDVVALLGPPEAAEGLDARSRAEPIPFERAIAFDDVTFRYPGGAEVLHGVDLEIAKGARVGIGGTSGSGKSTLVDLLLGLLEPSGGALRIDGRPLDAATRPRWQARVAHVPQALHLASTTIARNIAFGVPEEDVDHDRVRRAAAGAQLDAFIAGLPEGYDTPVGERGARLSGGQRQRVGIARALYKNADVLVFDEATDGLDAATERAVLDAIAALGRGITVVMVSHRSSALADCDVVVRLEEGRVVESGVRA